MGHLILAACSAARAAADELEAWMRAQPGPLGALAERVTRVDLDAGPPLTRARAIIGIGWHARRRIALVEAQVGVPASALVEVCGCGRHHMMGLGRVGPPAARWTPTARWVDRLAGREGAWLLWMEPGQGVAWRGLESAALARQWLADAGAAARVADALRPALLPGDSGPDLSSG